MLAAVFSIRYLSTEIASCNQGERDKTRQNKRERRKKWKMHEEIRGREKQNKRQREGEFQDTRIKGAPLTSTSANKELVLWKTNHNPNPLP